MFFGGKILCYRGADNLKVREPFVFEERSRSIIVLIGRAQWATLPFSCAVEVLRGLYYKELEYFEKNKRNTSEMKK